MTTKRATRQGRNPNRAKVAVHHNSYTRILTQQDKVSIGLGLIFGLPFGLCLLHWVFTGVIQ